ncbi:MAG: type II secretion system F family protein [Candidatus Bathyarchaeota archaeon]|nr:type II secretion system F family protein [Candidatus Bathyarchaeota archaeon]
MYFYKKLRVAVWAVSTLVGLTVILLPFLLRQYTPTQPYLIPITQQINNTIAFGLVIMLGFPAVVEYNNYRWGRQIEQAIPRLLRDIAEAVRSGVTLPRAVEEASQRSYGPISKELEYALAKFLLGASWEEAMNSLTKRINRPIIARLATILVEANQTGGKVSEVLDTSVQLFSSLEEYKEEQLNNTRPYLLTIYMATAIFLVIAYVVLTQFLAPLAVSSAQQATTSTATLANVLDINYYKSILFWASIIESFFGGLISGKIGERSYLAGLRHSIILIAITLVFFNFTGI